MRETLYTAPGRTPGEAADRETVVVQNYRERAAARRRRMIDRASATTSRPSGAPEASPTSQREQRAAS